MEFKGRDAHRWLRRSAELLDVLKRRRFAILVVVVACAALTVSDTGASDSGTMLVGVTHGQYSADAWGDPVAVAHAKSILRTSFPIQNQHVMGFGVPNPEPTPGVYNFASLDKRVALMRETGARPVLTLCCSPDWMKGGAPGTTDWSKIETAPIEQHFDDFAALAATIARRYPDVHDFLVWNEMKSFFDASTNRWDYEHYTELYNKVYDALKAVNPAIRVGGPYITMNSWQDRSEASHPSEVSGPWGVLDQRSLDVLTYWLANAHGADYVVVDGSIANRADDSMPTIANVAKLEAVDHWLRSRTTLPIFWSEVDLGPLEANNDADTGALLSAALGALARSDTSIVLLWQPQATKTSCQLCMWTDTTAGGGQPTTPYLTVARALSDQPVATSDFTVPPISPLADWPTGIAGTNATAVRLG